MNTLDTNDIVFQNSYKPKIGSHKPTFASDNVNNNFSNIDTFYFVLLTVILWILLIGSWYGLYQGGINSTIVYFSSFFILVFAIFLGGKLKTIERT